MCVITPPLIGTYHQLTVLFAPIARVIDSHNLELV